MEHEFEKGYLIEELESLEREYRELENVAFEETLLDPITIKRVKKRKSWIKSRLESIKSALYPEVIA